MWYLHNRALSYPVSQADQAVVSSEANSPHGRHQHPTVGWTLLFSRLSSLHTLLRGVPTTWQTPSISCIIDSTEEANGITHSVYSPVQSSHSSEKHPHHQGHMADTFWWTLLFSTLSSRHTLLRSTPPSDGRHYKQLDENFSFSHFSAFISNAQKFCSEQPCTSLVGAFCYHNI